MREYKTVETTYEVWKAIKAAHSDHLVVFGSFTDISDVPDGKTTVFTSYGFHHGDFPVMEAVSTCENDEPWLDEFGVDVGLWKHKNEQHKYYLCLPSKQED